MKIIAIALPYWFSYALLGSVFTLVGVVKIYGLCRGVIGGRDKPFAQYACGTCPTWVGCGWKGRILRYGMPFLFLGIGIWNLAALAWEIHVHVL
jgi:hypothetical protein